MAGFNRVVSDGHFESIASPTKCDFRTMRNLQLLEKSLFTNAERRQILRCNDLEYKPFRVR